MTELEQLRHRVAELEELLGMPARHPRSILIGPSIYKLACLLARWPFVSHEFAIAAMYNGMIDADRPLSSTIRQNICRLRRDLKPYGITIETERYSGYYVSAAGREHLSKLVGGEAHSRGATDPATG